MKKNLLIAVLAVFALSVSSIYAAVTVMGDGFESNDTSTVKPATVNEPVVDVQTPTGGVDPVITSPGGITSTVTTLIGEGSIEASQTTGGGVTLETNGNGTFEGGKTTEWTGEFDVVTEFEVENIGQPNPGVMVPGTQKWHIRKTDGTIVKTFTTQAAKDAYLAAGNEATVFTDLDNAGAIDDDTETAPGGDVIIRGNLALGDDGTGTDTPVIPDVEAAITGNATAINNEVATRTDLIREVGGEIHIGNDSIITSVVGGQQMLRAEQGGNPIDLRISGGTNLIVDGSTTTGTLSVGGNATVGNSLTVNNDATIKDDLSVWGDTNVSGTTTTGYLTVNNNATVGNDLTVNDDLVVVDNASVGNDLSVGNALYVGDDVYVGGSSVGLKEQIDDNADDIADNRRGIAMVAAMTNTRVEAGNTQALDVNISSFGSEQGLGLGYSVRVNDNLQLNFAGASTLDFDGYVVRAGIGLQW